MDAAAAVSGRVAWRRYAVILASGLAVAGILVTLSAQNALATSFAIAGPEFKLSADSVDGTGFVSYSTVDTSVDGKHTAVTPSGFTTAELHNLCQSVVSPSPFGDITMRLTAGSGDTPVKATNMVADYSQLAGDITFTGYAGGVDASRLNGPATGAKGSWGQQAQKIHIDKLRQNVFGTTASTFKLAGLKIDVSFGKHECF
jgi:hypothetical protein